MSQHQPNPDPADATAAAASSLVTWSLNVDELTAWMPDLLADLSPTRQAIVRDSLDRSIADSVGHPVWVVAADASPLVLPMRHRPAWIALIQPVADGLGIVLHVRGPAEATRARAPLTRPTKHADEALAFRAILHQTLRRHRLEFIQWASDPMPIDPLRADSREADPIDSLGRSLGFECMGTLDYLSLDGPPLQSAMARVRPARVGRCEPLNHDDDDAVASFESLVRQTYAGSMDCPDLERHRTPAQILHGYRTSPAFSPPLWFTLCGDDDIDGEPVGCLILARHVGDAGPVIELVYMGVVPEHRGHRWGESILRAVLDVVSQQHATRLILAVDRRNEPARNLYHRWSMQPIFSETVWVQSSPPSTVGAV